ncbi:hypothetical protein BD779DRAFT_1449174 [Infundibulicybe gibba]|nr:hypothetical protein BD779DRAFT_1449174 [Infundibulicybe gibba]
MRASYLGHRNILIAAATGLVVLPACLAAIYENAADLPLSQYDFIIIGGGTAGNVVANRLSENRRHDVLVLEAGVSNEGVPEVIIPFFCTALAPNTAYDWNYTTVAQPGLDGRTMVYPRGHVLGGSSSINYMVYNRGTIEDFDRYSMLARDTGWSWNAMMPYMLKHERWSRPADNHNTDGKYDPSIHSPRGMTAVTLGGYSQAIDDRLFQTTKDLKDEFPFNLDMNSGRPLGVGWTQSTIDSDGKRSSSATSYLGPEYIKRPNLHVLLHAQVTRLVMTEEIRGKPSFKEVEFVQKRDGPRLKIRAKKEVILSAGAIGTPQILLNSGIGDRTELANIGVRPTFHLPDVGRNLIDHPLLSNIWYVNTTETIEKIVRNSTLFGELLSQWQNQHTGPFVHSPLSNQIIWSRLPKNTSLLAGRDDPAPGPNSAHYEILPVNGFADEVPTPGTGNFITLATIVLNPVSRGSVTLASSDPLTPPNIDPGFFKDPLDLAIMREAVKGATRFLSGPAWKGYVLEPYQDLAGADTDAKLDIHIKKHGRTVYHPVGTASMSPRGQSYGVVDPDLRVKGISGLRVVDASVLPRVPSVHPQAPIYFVAERAADLIKGSW